MRNAIALVTAGALVLVAAAPADTNASPRRYCGTTADGFPGVIAVGPTRLVNEDPVLFAGPS